MMQQIYHMQLSVVIITKNVANIISKTLQSLAGITDDIIIVDSGSTDDTLLICKSYPLKIINTTWDGYGANKNKGIAAAKHNWILSIDADEIVDKKLKKNLIHFNFTNEHIAYKLHRKNFFGNKQIHFGEWAGDRAVRIFNKNKILWNNAAVHESLILNNSISIQKMPGSLLHYTTKNLEDYIAKSTTYAKLNAQKYFSQQKQANVFKLVVAPATNFLQHYIFRLGFLDGWEGFVIAKTSAKSVFLKYLFLKQLYKKSFNKMQSHIFI